MEIFILVFATALVVTLIGIGIRSVVLRAIRQKRRARTILGVAEDTESMERRINPKDDI